jgi:hypothetical protein
MPTWPSIMFVIVTAETSKAKYGMVLSVYVMLESGLPEIHPRVRSPQACDALHLTDLGRTSLFHFLGSRSVIQVCVLTELYSPLPRCCIWPSSLGGVDVFYLECWIYEISCLELTNK